MSDMAELTLGIDTSGAVSVAVSDGCRILSRRMDERARHHDEVLLEMIDAALSEAGASRSDLTCVVGGRGPGPFTSLRVGLVTARSIATVLGARLIGVPSLDAIALEAAEGCPEAKTIAVALDARRREVYWALYEVSGEGSDASSRHIVRTFEPGVAAPADVASSLTAADVLVGSGAHLYPEILPPTGEVRHADAGFLIRAALSAEARGEDLTSTEPLYLREADAAKPKRRKSALGLGDRPL